MPDIRIEISSTRSRSRMKTQAYVALLLGLAATHALAAPSSEKVCALAPSQSKAMAVVAAAAGGSAAAIAAVGQAAGLTVVAHSSGAAILTGSGGYVAGTLGAAATGPAIVTVAFVVAGTAATIELVCVPKNHPEQVAKVKAAAVAFGERSRVLWTNAKDAVAPRVSDASVAATRVSGNVFAYANRQASNAGKRLGA